MGSEEFERMCQSLIQKIIGSGAKIYGMGKDGAREATYRGEAPYPSTEHRWNGNWIFQCKFHDTVQLGPINARKQILNDLNSEIKKIIKYGYSIDNYIFITNVSLTPPYQTGTKDRIDNEIIPRYKHKIKQIDVWGAEEVCRFLDSNTEIRNTYSNLLVPGDIIASLLKMIDREETDLDIIIKLYCLACFKYEQYAHLDDAEDVEDKRIELQRVFIDLDVESPALPSDNKLLFELPQWLKEASEDEDRTSALSYLLDDSIKGMVIEGGPGEGKSTLGQYLAQIYRSRLTGKLKELSGNTDEFEKCKPRIPFRILLKEYAQWLSNNTKKGSLFNYLSNIVSEKSGNDINSDQIQLIIKSNPIILILDGLDEVPSKKLRTKILDNIKVFVDQSIEILGCDLKVIATTRPYGYSEEFDPFHYLHLELKGLSPEKAIRYAKLWTTARQPDPEDAKEILETFVMCLDDRVVQVLTKTPLQVTILLFIINSRGTPPKQKEELFEKYMDIIYLREQKKRSKLIKTEKEIIYGLHQYLAFILHRRAEMDETVALMDVSEFKDKVTEYIEHKDPSLNEEEIKCTVNQIIKEVRERLVLIESPVDNKVGFSLTSIREFFAASFLVDSSETSNNRNERFKTISTSPHWRNVALFFTGRVGRNLPGEAPSIINVCHEIDSEGFDKHLQRGAGLVMDILDDRALREPRDVFAALKYGIIFLENRLIQPFNLEYLPFTFREKYEASFEQIKIQLNNFSDKNKRFVSDIIEDKLKTTTLERIGLYVDTYQYLSNNNELKNVFIKEDLLKNIIKKITESNLSNFKLWGLSKALDNNIYELWVIEQFEEVLSISPMDTIIPTFEDYFFHLAKYSEFPISTKLKDFIICIGLRFISKLEFGLYRHSFINTKKELFNKIEDINVNGKNIENSLIFWAMAFLIKLSILNSEKKLSRYEYNYGRGLKSWNFPFIAHPDIKELILENMENIETFCETFSSLDAPFINLITRLFEFLLNPLNYETYDNLYKERQKHDLTKPNPFLTLGLKANKMNSKEYFLDLGNIFKLYSSEESYKMDIKEFDEILNRDSLIPNHAFKMLFWISSSNENIIEEFLDPNILNDLKKWLQDRQISKNVININFNVLRDLDLNTYSFIINIITKELLNGKKDIDINYYLRRYTWNLTATTEELEVKDQLKNLFEIFLKNYSSINDPDFVKLSLFFNAALNANILEENHLLKVYKLINRGIDFPLKYSYLFSNKKVYMNLFNLLKSDIEEVSILSALVLASIPHWHYFFNKEEQSLISDVLWKQVTKNKENDNNIQFLNGLSRLKIKWTERHDEILKLIQNSNKKETISWGIILINAGYFDSNDRESLLKLLLKILNSEEYEKSIKLASLIRLNEVVTENEPVEFTEYALNSPLYSERKFFV